MALKADTGDDVLEVRVGSTTAIAQKLTREVRNLRGPRTCSHDVPIGQAGCLARKPRMRRAISSFFSSRAKWPASSRCSSASGRSRLYASAPGAMNEGSFRPQTTKVGGLCSRNHACHPEYEATFVR